MNERIAKCLLQEAIKKLYEQDDELFDDVDKIYERAIAFRLAHHLANIIEERKCCGNGITVDCEYERHNLDKKRCFVPCNRCESGCSVAKRIKENKALPKTMRPDIIVHRRRSNERNLLTIGIKTSLNLQRNPDSRDAAKLACMTCALMKKAGNPKESYHYNIGITLNLAKEKSGCWIFKDGGQDGCRHDLTRGSAARYIHQTKCNSIRMRRQTCFEETPLMAAQKTWYRIEGKIPYEVADTLREQGILRLGIYDELAMKIIYKDKWPLAVKFPHRLWGWIAVLQMFAGLQMFGSIYLSFIWHWWAFIAGFVLVGILSNAIKKTARELFLTAL